MIFKQLHISCTALLHWVFTDLTASIENIQSISEPDLIGSNHLIGRCFASGFPPAEARLSCKMPGEAAAIEKCVEMARLA